MPAARRRRSRSAARRGRGRRRQVLWALLIAVTALLAVGSLAEIRAQSGDFRTETDVGYGAAASKLVSASNQTGGQLAALMETAPQLANRPLPYTARAVLQQGLDDAVNATAEMASRTAALVPPDPAVEAGPRLTAIMSDRASAARALRSNVDQLLGMTPLPVAGGPQSSAPPAPALLISPDQAAAGMNGAGILFQHADGEYRRLLSDIRAHRIPIRLPPSVWVPSPVGEAPLSPARLGASAAQLKASPALVPFHQLVITAIGLDPAPVTSGGPQAAIPGCTAPQSNTLGGSVTVMPPTASVRSTVTVTNCGTVVEPVVQVTETLALADAAGTPPPPASVQAEVSLRSGSSGVLSMQPLPVASGHRYTLTFAIALPVSQAANNPAGSTQTLVLQIAG